MDGHSSGTPVAERLARPTRMAGRKRPRPRGLPSLLGLAPGGVCPAAAVAGSAVRSYRTISPLPPARPKVLWGWRCVSVALSLGSPPPGVTRHRISMEPGLSSPVREQPSGRLALHQKGSAGGEVKWRGLNRRGRRRRGCDPCHPMRNHPSGRRGLGGVFSVALSLGSPPPGVTRHRASVEPGLSSLRAKRRAAIRPSGALHI